MFKHDRASAIEDLMEAQELCDPEETALKHAIKTSMKNLVKKNESDFPASADPQSGDMFAF